MSLPVDWPHVTEHVPRSKPTGAQTRLAVPMKASLAWRDVRVPKMDSLRLRARPASAAMSGAVTGKRMGFDDWFIFSPLCLWFHLPCPTITPKMRLEETIAPRAGLWRPERGVPAPRDSDAPVTRRAGALRSDARRVGRVREFSCPVAPHRCMRTYVGGYPDLTPDSNSATAVAAVPTQEL